MGVIHIFSKVILSAKKVKFLSPFIGEVFVQGLTISEAYNVIYNLVSSQLSNPLNWIFAWGGVFVSPPLVSLIDLGNMLSCKTK